MKITLKKYIVIVTLFFSRTSYNATTLSLRALAFIPTACRFTAIYGTSGPALELEAATTLYSCLQAWANIDWFCKHGRSIGFCDPTKINITNFSVGLKIPYTFYNCFSVVTGLGTSIGTVTLSNKSLSCCESISQNAVGLVIKSGIFWQACEQTFFELFVDYIYQRIRFDQRVNISGLRTGIGCGISF